MKAALEKYGLKLNLMHGTNKSVPFEESLEQYGKRLRELAHWRPVVINSQTGSDLFTQEQNEAFITVANTISKETGIPIYHETHRADSVIPSQRPLNS